MRAKFVECADTAFAVPEHHHVFAEQANAQWSAVGFGDFLDHAGRKPMLAHQAAHRGIVFNAAKQVILFRCHCVSP